MKKLVAVLLLTASAAFAQHSVQLLGYTDSVTGVNFNIYRANCGAALVGGLCPTASEGTFLKIGTNAGPPYTDSTVVGGSVYSYYVTAFCVTCPTGYSGESTPSSHVGAAIPLNNPPPPSGLVIGTVAYNFSQGKATVAANWTDGPATTWTLKSGATVLAGDNLTSATGQYSIQWSGKKPKYTPVLTVCDANGCLSKAAS